MTQNEQSKPPAKKDEHVLVLPSNRIMEALAKYNIKEPQNKLIRGLAAFEVLELCEKRPCQWSPRSICETEPSLRQIIPYVLIKHGENILASRRKAKQSETRLHGKRHIGFGGHIDIAFECNGGIYAGAARELQEELGYNVGPFTFAECARFLGVIVSNCDDAAKVHLGLVFIYNVFTPNINTTEEGFHAFEWMKAEDLKHGLADAEAWTQFIIEAEFNAPILEAQKGE